MRFNIIPSSYQLSAYTFSVFSGNAKVSHGQNAVSGPLKPRVYDDDYVFGNQVRAMSEYYSDRLREQSAALTEHFYASDEQLKLGSGKSSDVLLSEAAYRIQMAAPQYVRDAFGTREDLNMTTTNGLQLKLVHITDAERAQQAELALKDDPAAMIFNRNQIQMELNWATDTVYGTGWTGVSGIDHSFQGVVLRPSQLNFHDQVENLAAYYAFYEQQANDLLGGNERTDAMTMVEEEFETALNRVIDSLTLLHYLGADKEGVADSVRSMFTEQKTRYADLLRSDSFDLGLGKDGEWGAKSAYYVAARLRQQSEPADLAGYDAKYSVDDIRSMAVLSKQSFVKNAAGQSTNELEIGMWFGMEAAMIESFVRSGRLSDAARSTVMGAFHKTTAEIIRKANENIERAFEDPCTPKEHSITGLPIMDGSLDLDLTQKALDVMLGSLQDKNMSIGLRRAVSKLDEMYSVRYESQMLRGYVDESFTSPISFLYNQSGNGYGLANAFTRIAQYLEKPELSVSGEVLLGQKSFFA
jgi:hypothetical protein